MKLSLMMYCNLYILVYKNDSLIISLSLKFVNREFLQGRATAFTFFLHAKPSSTRRARLCEAAAALAIRRNEMRQSNPRLTYNS
jgi:hypothetical protein